MNIFIKGFFNFIKFKLISSFVFNPLKSAILHQKYALKRLEEIQKLVLITNNNENIEKTIESFQTEKNLAQKFLLTESFRAKTKTEKQQLIQTASVMDQVAQKENVILENIFSKPIISQQKKELLENLKEKFSNQKGETSSPLWNKIKEYRNKNK